MSSLDKARRVLLMIALALAVALFAVDRYAAYVHRPAADSTRVVIYTTQWCPYCKRLRTDLAANGIPYTEYDVEHSVQGALGFWALHARGVPVSAIGPKIVYGYRVGRIESALGDLGYSYRQVSSNAPSALPAGSAPVSVPGSR